MNNYALWKLYNLLSNVLLNVFNDVAVEYHNFLV